MFEIFFKTKNILVKATLRRKKQEKYMSNLMVKHTGEK